MYIYNAVGLSKVDLLPSISAILWFELWLSPLLRVLDISGNLERHLLAPVSQCRLLRDWLVGSPRECH